MDKLLLLIICGWTFVFYVLWISHRFGVLPSISDSYYHLKGLWKSLFTLAMFTIGFTFSMLEVSGLQFWAGAFICFVGTAPAFRKESQKKVHAIGAIGGIVLGYLSCWIDFGEWVPLVIFGVLAFLIDSFRIKNSVWWIEILAFAGIFIVYFIKI